MPRKHLLISGRVQGVGFRYYTQTEAQRLGVTGWVRNCHTGEVEIEAQASGAALEAFLNAVAKGPVFSSVANVAESNMPEVENEKGFRMRW